MKLVVVDDDALDLNKTIESLNRFVKDNNCDLEWDVYNSAEAYLNSKKEYQIGIFDIVMPNMTGMELAYKLREDKNDIAIVFLTSIAKYAVEGYLVNACGYVVKPLNYYSFSLTLKRAIKTAQSTFGDDNPKIVKVGTATINMNLIQLCEVKDHTLIYHLDNETIKCRGSMSEIEKIDVDRFVKPHNSYLINLKAIQKIKGNEIVLKNGIIVPIARAKKKEFLSKYATFVGGNN